MNSKCIAMETNTYNTTRAYLDEAKVGYTVDADGFMHLTEWLCIPRDEIVTLDGIKSGNVVMWEGATYTSPNHTTGNVIVWWGATYNGLCHREGKVWVYEEATCNIPNHRDGNVTVWENGTYNGKAYKHKAKP